MNTPAAIIFECNKNVIETSNYDDKILLVSKGVADPTHTNSSITQQKCIKIYGKML